MFPKETCPSCKAILKSGPKNSLLDYFIKGINRLSFYYSNIDYHDDYHCKCEIHFSFCIKNKNKYFFEISKDKFISNSNYFSESISVIFSKNKYLVGKKRRFYIDLFTWAESVESIRTEVNITESSPEKILEEAYRILNNYESNLIFE